MGKTIIYQMLPRLWGAENRQPGKFSDIDNQTLEYLVGLGISHVWFTGVIRHATTYSCKGCPESNAAIVKGNAGSPYAITDYYDVNPYLAKDPRKRMQEFKMLLKRTHAHGLKAIIDFVPNHVSRDYGRVGLVNEKAVPFGAEDDLSVHWKPSNDFYYYPGQVLSLPIPSDYKEYPAKASGNVFSPAPGINDWYDTVKLNYCDFHTETWDKMLDIVRYWCSLGVDGFRCDMVELVPWQFMQWLIQNVKNEYPDVIFIGEVYKKELYGHYIQTVGFDFLYDKSGLYDSLRALIEGHGTAKSITWNWQSLGPLQPRMLNFLENHDEQRFASDFFAKDARRTFAPLGAGLLFNTAPYMVYFGEEIGERGMDQEGFSGLDGRTSIFDWWSIDSIGRLRQYISKGIPMQEKEMSLLGKWREFLSLAGSDRAFSDGKTFDLCYCNTESAGFIPDRHFAFLRSWGDHAFLVVCNFSSSTAKIAIRIPPEAFSYLELSKKTPETIEVTVSGDDCVIVKI